MNITELTQAHKESMPWLAGNTILVARSGSHAYGTNLPSSDEDFKGVAVPPKKYFTGFLNRFEQAEQHEPFDCVIYDIRKFCNLAADCNPSILEVLFVDQADIIQQTKAGATLRAHAEKFLSRKAKHTFGGYAVSQLNRIKGHYAWLKNPPKKQPERADFGLPDYTLIPKDQRTAAMAAIDKKLATWNVDLDPLDEAAKIDIMARIKTMLEDIHLTQDSMWRAAARAIGLTDNFIQLMEAERAYKNASNQWQSYQTWLKQRNPARAELEAKFGYDTKHGMHLVRLLRMGHEILTTGKVLVKRPDAEELLAIRWGLWPYEQMLEYAESMQRKLDEAYETSVLPKAPDRNYLDTVCQTVVDNTLSSSPVLLRS